MKNLLILSGLLLLIALPGLGQKHEVGAAGNFVLGYPQGKDNSSELRCGWRAGAYYRYVPNKWIGLQSGVYVQGFDENHAGAWKSTTADADRMAAVTRASQCVPYRSCSVSRQTSIPRASSCFCSSRSLSLYFVMLAPPQRCALSDARS